ncbi:MAG TPA: hypothetical protein VGM05_15355 [Planctomycetaceae bacterium]
MFRDPIVEEVRAIREQLAAQFDFDIRRIVVDAQRRQTTSKARIVSFQQAAKPAKLPAAVDLSDSNCSDT